MKDVVWSSLLTPYDAVSDWYQPSLVLRHIGSPDIQLLTADLTVAIRQGCETSPRSTTIYDT